MPVPRRKTSRARRNNRRSHHGLKVRQLNRCPQCGEPKLPHCLCKSCGFYRGREVVRAKEAKKKK